MRISILLPNLAGGGAERLHIELAREFDALGNTVEFWLMDKKGELLEEAENEFKVVNLHASRVRQLPIQLMRQLRRNPPDVLLSAMWPVTGIAIIAILVSRVPTRVIVSEHVDFRLSPSITSIERKILHFLGSAIYSKAENIIAVSEGVAESLVDKVKLNRKDISVIHNPVRKMFLEEFPVADNLKLRKWIEAEYKIISIGSLKRQKGFDNLVKAIKHLHLRNHEVSLLILGEGECRQELEAQVANLELQNFITVPGFRSNPAPYLKMADLFVLSSNWEGFGNVIVESLSMGVPVVSTDCPSGPAEILDGGRYGRLVPPGDHVKLADAIAIALKEPRDSISLVERARTFSVEKAARRYLELMQGSQ